IWRSSISNQLVFQTFKLNLEIEEEIRNFLNENLKNSHSELLQSLNSITKFPSYHFCIVKPKNKSRGIFTAYEFAENSYAIFTVDYALFFYTNKEPLIKAHKIFSNYDMSPVRIA